jgi:branched-chain amino acid transport system substrate-binding protein
VTPTVEYYQRGTTNFAALVARIMAQDPGVVELAGLPPGDSGTLVKQALEAGYDGAFDRSGAGAEIVIRAVGGVDKLKKFFWEDQVPTEDPAIQRLKADFQRTMNTPAPENSLFPPAQIATEQILRAISAAGTDQDAEKIAAELRKSTPESRYLGKLGWRGKTEFGINQELAFPVAIGLIVDGKQQPQVKIDVKPE